MRVAGDDVRGVVAIVVQVAGDGVRSADVGAAGGCDLV